MGKELKIFMGILVLIIGITYTASSVIISDASGVSYYYVFVAPKGTVSSYDDPVCEWAKIKGDNLIIKGSFSKTKTLNGKLVSLLTRKRRSYPLSKGYTLTYMDYNTEEKLSKKEFNSLDAGFAFVFKVNEKGEVTKILGVN